MLRRIGLLAVACSCCLPSARADEPKTLLTERGKLLVREEFAKPIQAVTASSLNRLTSGWRLKPGQWEVIDGALQGTQLKEDHHSAVASLAVPFQDAVIQVDCQLGAARRLTVRVNDTKEHVCRMAFDQRLFTAQKDDRDHEGPDQAVPFGEQQLTVAADQWVTVLLEIHGEELVATIDGRSITGSHPRIGTPKANIGLVVTGLGGPGRFCRLRVWEALPNPAWAENKARILKTSMK